jgi:hypothetical protein
MVSSCKKGKLSIILLVYCDNFATPTVTNVEKYVSLSEEKIDKTIDEIIPQLS